MITVTIPPELVRDALLCAAKRNGYCCNHNARDRHLESNPTFGGIYAHETGCLTEMAFRLYAKLPTALAVNGEFHLPDAMADIEIRGSRTPSACLLLRKKDEPRGMSKRWVLAIVPHIYPTGTLVHLKGWAFGDEVMKPEYWQDKNGKGFAWWMPADRLRPMETLL